MDNKYKIELGITLNDKDLASQIGNLNPGKPLEIEVKLIDDTIKTQISDIRKQILDLNNIKINLGGANVGNGRSSNGINNSANKLITEYNKLRNISKNIGSIKIKLDGLDASKDIQQIRVLEKQLQSLTKEYHDTVSKIKNRGDLSSTQWQSIQHQIENTEIKLEQLSGKFADARNEFARGIKIKLEDGSFKNDISDIDSKFNKLSDKSTNLKRNIDDLKNALKEMQYAADADDTEALIAAQERYKRILKDVQNQLKINARTEQDAFDSDILDVAKQNALLRLKNLFEDGSEAARKFGKEVDRLQKELNGCSNIKGVNKINKDITNLGLKIKEAGVQTQTFGSKLKTQFARYKDYISIASIITYTFQALKSMFDQVVAIDSAMTELKKVTNEADAAYDQFLSRAGSRAKEIGTTVEGLISSTADFARLGYGFEDAQGLAEVANIYAVVGDEIDGVEQATESLISTMAAFKDEANGMSNTDFAMSIIDKFNEIGKLIA